MKRAWHNGLVIGKFTPYHAGHNYLLQTADAETDNLTIIVISSREYEPDVTMRKHWIAEDFPNALIREIDKDSWDLDDDDSAGWAEATRTMLGHYPDVVFTSEDYGDSYVAELNKLREAEYARSGVVWDDPIDHFIVDLNRKRVPISGTAIRDDPLAHLTYIPEQVRNYYIKKICVIGAECTGKTTLCDTLAALYDTRFVPEYGRTYTEAMAYPEHHKWTSRELEGIGWMQLANEREAARYAGKVLISDTAVITTAIFHEVLMGHRDDELENLANAHTSHDLYILCDPTTPFRQDSTGIRMEDQRRFFHDRYLTWLNDNQLDYIEVKGDQVERIKQAVEAIDGLD
jgi:HTH-type transcriptional repressor of NAD biosynthesis genes